MATSDPRTEETGKAIAKALADESNEEWTVTAKDPGRGHFWVSMAKSALRFLAYGIMLGVGGGVAYAGIVLILAEVLGIAEELVD
jgi:hypothetical protein